MIHISAVDSFSVSCWAAGFVWD